MGQQLSLCHDGHKLLKTRTQGEKQPHRGREFSTIAMMNHGVVLFVTATKRRCGGGEPSCGLAHRTEVATSKVMAQWPAPSATNFSPGARSLLSDTRPGGPELATDPALAGDVARDAAMLAPRVVAGMAPGAGGLGPGFWRRGDG